MRNNATFYGKSTYTGFKMYTINNEATTDIKILANTTAEWFGEEEFDDDDESYYFTQIIRNLAIDCNNNPKSMRNHITQGVLNEFMHNDYFNATIDEYMSIFGLEDETIKQDIKIKLANVHLCYLEQIFIHCIELEITKYDNQEFDEIFEKRFVAGEHYFANTMLTPVINSVEFNELSAVLIQYLINLMPIYINSMPFEAKVQTVITTRELATQCNNDLDAMWNHSASEIYNAIKKIPYVEEYVSTAIDKICFENEELKQQYIQRLIQPTMLYTTRFNKAIIELSRIYSDKEIAKLINYEKITVEVITETLKNTEFQQLLKVALKDAIIMEFWNIDELETTPTLRPSMSP